MTGLNLFLFGPPRCERDGQALEIRPRKALALLAYLAVTHQAHSRDMLATLFWPDSDQSKGRGNLRRTLYRLTQTLGDEILTATTDIISRQLQADLWLDIDAFQQQMNAGLSADNPLNNSSPDQLDALVKATNIYTDDFMAGFTLSDCPEFDEWQFFQRERLRQSLAQGLQQLTIAHQAQTDFEAAIRQARRWLSLDLLHEPAHRLLMQLYNQSDQQAAAVRQYEACVRILDTELGLAPEEATVTLYEAIKAKRLVTPWLPTEARSSAKDQESKSEDSVDRQSLVVTPLPDTAVSLINLPPQSTPFIGREAELRTICQLLLAEPGCRLLTLVGLGGIGKTRLALAAAEQVSEGFPDGVCFIGLASVSDPTFIVSAIAEALSLNFYGVHDPQTQLLTYLRQKRLCLVLDNFEHLLDGVDLLSEILKTAPQVKLITTARERLNLQEEWSYEVWGMGFPALAEWPLLKTIDLETYSAIQLFLQCARRAKASFTLAEDDLPHLMRICQLVDGLPLGLELAAGWVDLLSLAEIAAEIQQSLDFLETDLRNVAQRHHNLRLILDYAWGRLTLREQHILAQLAIFRAGFTREAAEKITRASLHTLSKLVNKSLLQYNQTQKWYTLHELVRQYGQEKLKDDPTQARATLKRHGTYYCTRLKQLEAQQRGPQWQASIDELEADLKNVKASWRWAVEQTEAVLLSQAMDALMLFYTWRNYIGEGEAACQLVIDKFGAVAQPSTAADAVALQLLAKALGWQVQFSRVFGDAQRALELGQQSLAILASPTLAQEDTRLEKVLTLGHTAELFTASGNIEESIRRYEQSLALCQALAQPWWEAYTYLHFGQFLSSGDAQRAKHCFETALKLAQTLNSPWLIIRLILNLGWTAMRSDDFAEAKQQFETCMANAQLWEYQAGVLAAKLELGSLALIQGEAEQATQLFEQSIVIAQDIKDYYNLAYGQASLGRALTMMGQFEPAQAMIKTGLTTLEALSNRRWISYGWLLLGETYLHLGDYETAQFHFIKALDPGQTVNMGRIQGWGCRLLAQTLLARSDYLEARQRFQQSLEDAHREADTEMIAHALAGLSLTLCILGESDEALAQLRTAFRTAIQAKTIGLLWPAIPTVAFWFATQAEDHDWPQKERAMELYTLATRHPLIAQSRWFADVVGQPIAQIAEILPPDIVTAAQKRGQRLDWWTTAEQLWQDLTNTKEIASPAKPHYLPPQTTSAVEGAAIGQRFIQETFIASGGMGEVYQGRDTETGQRVAIKRIKPDLMATNPALVKRLIREGEALRRLNHPNIVKVLALIEDNGQPLIVMEYVPGGSLHNLLEKTPLPSLSWVLDLGLELADALARAHHLGILHRDIKPANVLLADDGSPRLTDFGVAHLGDQGTVLTQAGSILGTIAYLSPEACKGDRLDSRSDIWSFGALLFELLAGHPLFDKQHITATLAAILNDPVPDLANLRPDISPTLTELVKHMLVKDQAHRIDSMRQVAAGLEVSQHSFRRGH